MQEQLEYTITDEERAARRAERTAARLERQRKRRSQHPSDPFHPCPVLSLLSHLPCHFGVSLPHWVQKYTVFVLAMVDSLLFLFSIL